MKYLAYDISHRTTYEYVGSVSVSYHMLRLRPRDLPNQRCLSHALRIEPETAVISEHRDYFGNAGHFVTVEKAHTRLFVESISRVAVAPQFVPDADETPPWDLIRGIVQGDHSGSGLEAMEFVYDSPMVKISGDIADFAKVSFKPRRAVLSAAVDLTERIFREFAFDPSATNVSTPVGEVMENRRGVCQDFAHFQIACLRSIGVPARYVSGYLETDAPAGKEKLVGTDASHAWVSFFCPGVGWLDLDPTNGCIPSMRHVTVAWGRDYGDISPLRGVIQGSGEHTLSVEVDVVAGEETEDPVLLPAERGGWDSELVSAANDSV